MKRLLMCLVCFFAPALSEAQGVEESDRLREVLTVLTQCREAYYRLEDYRGTVLHTVREANGDEREERMDIAFRKPGFLSLRWESGLHKGTTLLARPGWNQGNLMLRLGEWFDFLTISVPATEVGEPFQPALRDMSDWLTALTALAQRPVTDRSLRMVAVQTAAPQLAEGQMRLSVPAFLIPFRDNTVATYEFVIERGTGIPTELLLRGTAGEVRQHVTYTDLQVNVGLPTQRFSWEQPGEDPPPTPRGTAIDLRGFTRHWQSRYGEITDYQGIWIVETGQAETAQPMRVAFKFRKPFDLYCWWDPGEGRFQEALTRQGWNGGRVRVRKTVWGMPMIGDLALEGNPAPWGEVSMLTEFGMHRLVARLQEQLLRGWLHAELQTRFLGVQWHEERPCYVIAFDFPLGAGGVDGSSRIVTKWDIAERLLVTYESFVKTGSGERRQERQAFVTLQVNAALTDRDFDATNPAYGFLLFRRAPWLDRFLTGRD